MNRLKLWLWWGILSMKSQAERSLELLQKLHQIYLTQKFVDKKWAMNLKALSIPTWYTLPTTHTVSMGQKVA